MYRRQRRQRERVAARVVAVRARETPLSAAARRAAQSRAKLRDAEEETVQRRLADAAQTARVAAARASAADAVAAARRAITDAAAAAVARALRCVARVEKGHGGGGAVSGDDGAGFGRGGSGHAE
jgi:hypothetical protein